MRASSLRRKTRLTDSAISRAVGGRLRSNSVKIARICATVTAGVFPPHPPALQDEEPQRQQRERDVVMPAHPTADLGVRQAHLPLALPEHLLDVPAIMPSKSEVGWPG